VAVVAAFYCVAFRPIVTVMCKVVSYSTVMALRFGIKLVDFYLLNMKNSHRKFKKSQIFKT
jgi:hypothetical protein